MTVFKTFHPRLSNISLSKSSCHFMVPGWLVKFGFTSSIIDLRREHQTRVIHAVFGHVFLKFEVTRKKLFQRNRTDKNKLHFTMSVQNVPSPTIQHFIEQVMSLHGSRLAHQIWFHVFHHRHSQGTPNKGDSCRLWLRFPKIRSDKKKNYFQRYRTDEETSCILP